MRCLECDKEASGPTRYCVDHHANNWHGWFAWHPVKLNSGEWKWLSVVIRKRVPKDFPLTRPVFSDYWYATDPREDW